ncbi:MAG: flagellar biosynthesis protein FlhB [Pseudomonadota bacterium]
MAEEQDDAEKTEEPSQRKLEKAREKGDVAKSQEVNTWFMMIAATLVVFAFAGWISTELAEQFALLMVNSHQIGVSDGGSVHLLASLMLRDLAFYFAGPLFCLVIAGIAGNVVQHGFLLSAEPLTPKLSKVSPISGLKRLFSGQSLMNFAKGIAKLGIVGAIMALIIWPERDRLDGFVTTDILSLAVAIKWLALKLLAGVMAVLTVVAVMDFLYQKQTWTKKQRMSMRELKDEFKQAEGDPHVKAKLRQIRLERGRRRMMQRVPEASVVITNPTHFAVALQYEQGMDAPICLAKGTDALALKIRETAKEHEIPVVENPPLARALHASVDIDETIHPDHYKAVAEVIGFVMRQKRERAAWRRA